MNVRRPFPPKIIAALREGKILGIRAGEGPHRIIGIWAVVVRDRLFVRSWSRKAGGWYRTLLEDPRGVIEVSGRRLRVRAVPARSEALKKAVDLAYREKYNTPGAAKYVEGFRRSKARRDSTLELVPQ